jgi:H+/Cl- antiporter ClcA
MAGAFGGLFSSPVLGTALTLEVARPPRSRVRSAFFGAVIASSTSLGIYFAVAGSVFLGLYEVPAYAYEDWQLLAGAGLGILAAAVVLVSLAIITGTKRIVTALKLPPLVLPVLGGVLFGLTGVALPLTNFTGSDQLTTVVSDGSSLGAGLLLATLLAKMFTFAVSSATGFIGGPIFPMLFIGGTAGVIVHLLVPGIPLGLAFTCMLAAVPGSIVAAPFSLVLLTAVLTQVGALQTSPILIAVTTAFLSIAGIKLLVARRRATAPDTT